MEKGVWCAVLSVFAYSVGNLFGKIALNDGVNPTILITFKMVIAFILMYLLFVYQKKDHKELFEKRNIVSMILIAVTMVVVPKLFNSWALSMLSLSELTIISSTTVLFTSIMAYFILKERLPKKFFAFAIAAIVGLIIVVWPLDNFITNFAYLFIIISAISYAFSNVWIHKTKSEISTLGLNLGRTGIGAIGLILITLFTAYTDIGTLSYSFLSVLLSSVLFTIGTLNAYESMRLIGPSIYSGIDNSKPVLTVLLAVIFLGDILTSQFIVGAMIILISTYIISKMKAKYAGEDD